MTLPNNALSKVISLQSRVTALSTREADLQASVSVAFRQIEWYTEKLCQVRPTNYTLTKLVITIAQATASNQGPKKSTGCYYSREEILADEVKKTTLDSMQIKE